MQTNNVAGDITPSQGMSKEEKHRIEREAFGKIRDLLPDGKVGLKMYEYYCEYEDGKTKEAQFVKKLDKFEMILQAFEYEKGREKENNQCVVDFFSDNNNNNNNK